jgi:hypothetical protein
VSVPRGHGTPRASASSSQRAPGARSARLSLEVRARASLPG